MMVQGAVVAKMTSIGATVAVKTQLHNATDVIMPATARELVGVIPYVVGGAITAAQSIAAKISLESDDIKSLTPVETLPPIATAILGATGQTSYGLLKLWELHAPLSGGERVRVYGTNLMTVGAANYAGAMLVVSDTKGSAAQLKYKMGTVTSTGTSAADVPGTSFSIAGAKQIVKVLCGVWNTTVAAADRIAGHGYLESADFQSAIPIKYPIQPIGPGLSTLISTSKEADYIEDVLMPVNNPCNIIDHLFLELAPGTAGGFVTVVGFN